MDESRGLLSSLIMGIRRAVTEGVSAMRVDLLLTLAEILLRMFVMLLALSSADLVIRPKTFERILCDLNDNDCEDYSYHLRVNFSGE